MSDTSHVTELATLASSNLSNSAACTLIPLFSVLHGGVLKSRERADYLFSVDSSCQDTKQ